MTTINWHLIVREARARRKALKMTQKQLADLCQVSTVTISAFENSDHKARGIKMSTVLEILKWLGMVEKEHKQNEAKEFKPLFPSAPGQITMHPTEQDLFNEIHSKLNLMRNELDITMDVLGKTLQRVEALEKKKK